MDSRNKPMLTFPFSKARNWDLEMQTDFAKITEGSGITTKVPFLYCRMVSSDTLLHFFHLGKKKKKNHLRTQNLAIPVLYTFNTERSFPRWQTAGRSRWLGGKCSSQGLWRTDGSQCHMLRGPQALGAFKRLFCVLGFASVKQCKTTQTTNTEIRVIIGMKCGV